MTNSALLLDQTVGDASEWTLSPSPKMKFNPGNKTLVGRIVDLKFTTGIGRLGVPLQIGTSIKAGEGALIDKILYDATATYERIKLPTMADYEDFEEINDIESTENILYHASRKISW